MAVALANPIVALRTYLRESTVLADADHLGSNQKIYIGWPRDKGSPISAPPYQNMIVIMSGRGGAGDIGMGRNEERVDIFCYGIDDVRCYELWRAMEFYLNPIDGNAHKFTFTRNDCQINFILREGGPIKLVDTDAADWPYTMASYIINFNGQSRTI